MNPFKLVLFALLFFSTTVFAHPLAPTLWSIDEQAKGHYSVIWKTPLTPTSGVHQAPVFPETCQAITKPTHSIEGSGKVAQWTIRCQPASLIGQNLQVSGLEANSAGVLFRITFRDGDQQHRLLSSEAPHIVIQTAPDTAEVFLTYLLSGIKHLVYGIDHVLFICLLTLLVGWNRQLIWTVTLFTLGHSATLSLTALGFVSFPIMLVESLIAFSIVAAAVEVIKRDSHTFFRRYPWIAAGSFGLLHGMGFASVLSDVGLPANDIPLALAAFNIGIETGQLFIIGILLASWKLIKSIKLSFPAYSYQACGYLFGIVAAYWFWERLGVPAFI